MTPTSETLHHNASAGRFLNGLNAALTTSTLHDSYLGWYTAVTAAASLTFSNHYAADASFSVYPYRLAPRQTPIGGPSQQPQPLVETYGDVGDTFLGFHASFMPYNLQNTTTLSMTIPTGNRPDGLGQGRVTFDLSNHVERYVRNTGAVLDLGVGDSSGLFNRLATNDLNLLGPIAHFQSGVVYFLRGRTYLQSVAYEQLPIGDQKLYTTLTRPGFPNMTVVSGRNVSEDNGFTSSAGIPLTAHLSLSGYYNRSLRLHLDTVSTSLTYVFRRTPPKAELPLIDRALREAEGQN